MSTAPLVRPSPFDAANIARQIDIAVATLRPEERFALTARIDNVAGLGASLVIRGPALGPLKSSAVVTVTRPLAAGGGFAWSASARISGIARLPVPSWFFPETRGLYRVLRKLRNRRADALVKALLLAYGQEVRLINGRTA